MRIRQTYNMRIDILNGEFKTPTQWSAWRISAILTIVSLILWSYSIVQAELNIGFLGLIHSFPITYFVSLGILTIASAIAWISKEDCTKLLFIQLSLLVVSFWLVPVLIGGTSPFTNHIYRDFGNADYIIRHGHFDPEVLDYLNWPGAQMLLAIAIEILGLNSIPHGFLANSTFFMMILILITLYAFLNNIFSRKQSKKHIWAVLWVFCIGCIGGPVYFSPPGIGFLLILYSLILITALERENIKPIGIQVCIILVNAALTFVHLLTALYGLSIVITLYIYKRSIAISFILLLVVFIAAWQIYIATSYFSYKLPIFLESALDLDALSSSIFDRGIAGNDSHKIVNGIRSYYTLLLVAMAGCGGILAYKFKKVNPNDMMMLVMLGAILITTIGVGAAYGGFHIITRMLIFILPILAYFTVKWLDFRRLRFIFIAFLLIALPLHFISYYGNQTYDYLSPSYIRSLNFFENGTSDATIYTNGILGLPKQQEQFDMQFIGNIYRYEGKDSLDITKLVTHSEGELLYVHVDEQDEARFDFQFNDAEFFHEWNISLSISPYLDHIYANGNTDLYSGKSKE